MSPVTKLKSFISRRLSPYKVDKSNPVPDIPYITSLFYTKLFR